MLERVHLVAEGTLIYLSETSEVFIRVRNGWRKLQVLLHEVLILWTPLLIIVQEFFTWVEKYRCKDSFFCSEAPGDTDLLAFPFGFFQLGELIPIPVDSLPPPAISSHVSTQYWTVKNWV